MQPARELVQVDDPIRAVADVLDHDTRIGQPAEVVGEGVPDRREDLGLFLARPASGVRVVPDDVQVETRDAVLDLRDASDFAAGDVVLVLVLVHLEEDAVLFCSKEVVRVPGRHGTGQFMSRVGPHQPRFREPAFHLLFPLPALADLVLGPAVSTEGRRRDPLDSPDELAAATDAL